MSNFDSQKSESVLFIDIGNSSIKIAFKSDKKWKVYSYESANEAANLINNHLYPVKSIILSSVREAVKDALESKVESHLINELLIIDIEKDLLDYQTPETLGVDRYLACYGAQIHTKKPVVVIDAGSACTIDYMDDRGVFKGGVIMPGFTSILNVFNRIAPELPKIEIQFPKHFPGKTTNESLELGQVVFYTDGISKMLERYTKIYGEYDLYVSGGDAEIVNELIGNKGVIQKNLIFDGMMRMVTVE